MQKNIIVEGMHCAGCENRIKNACMKIDGVLEISPNHEAGIVTVTTNNESIIDQVASKIDDLGFTVKEVK